MSLPWAAVGQVWKAASDAAKTATVAWAASTADCKAAISHATYHVVGACGVFGAQSVPQMTPGFGPFSLGWGWCLLGVLFGFLLGLNFWEFVQRAEKIIQWMERARRGLLLTAPGLNVMPPWHAVVQTELRTVADGPRKIVLQRLAEEGDSALDLLAAAGGISKRDALARVIGVQVVHANAVAWRL